jgi:hypothetical protein
MLLVKTLSKTVHSWRHTAYAERKWNYAFSSNMRSEMVAFLLKTWREMVRFQQQRSISENLIMKENFTFN